MLVEHIRTTDSAGTFKLSLMSSQVSRAKALLKEKGVRWKELDIEADPAHRQAMAEASGRSSVPQIFINGTLIGGSDELFALDVRGELDKLLGRNPPAT